MHWVRITSDVLWKLTYLRLDLVCAALCTCTPARLSVCACFQVLADAVSRLVVDKFSELTDNFTSPHARRKVLAGVVMTTGNNGGGGPCIFVLALFMKQALSRKMMATLQRHNL